MTMLRKEEFVCGGEGKGRAGRQRSWVGAVGGVGCGRGDMEEQEEFLFTSY